MKEPIPRTFESISDEELLKAIEEIKENNELGIIKNGGIVRKYAKIFSTITLQSFSKCLFSTETSLLREAANRWYKNKNS